MPWYISIKNIDVFDTIFAVPMWSEDMTRNAFTRREHDTFARGSRRNIDKFSRRQFFLREMHFWNNILTLIVFPEIFYYVYIWRISITRISLVTSDDNRIPWVSLLFAFILCLHNVPSILDII